MKTDFFTRSRKYKKDDDELLNKYKGVAPKGPGFTPLMKVIFSIITIAIIVIIFNLKTYFIGTTPIKILNHSLNESIYHESHDITLEYDDNTLDFKYNFDLNTALLTYNGKDMLITLDSIITKDDNYSIKNILINGKKGVSFSYFKDIIHIKSIPNIIDILEDNIDLFITYYYDQFKFKPTDSYYKCVSLTTENDLYDYFHHFLEFNKNNKELKESFKQVYLGFLKDVVEYKLYDYFTFDAEDVEVESALSLEEVSLTEYIQDYDRRFEDTYILLFDYLNRWLEENKNRLDSLDYKLTLDFYIDKKYKVKEVHMKVNDQLIKYKVNHDEAHDITIQEMGEINDSEIDIRDLIDYFKKASS